MCRVVQQLETFMWHSPTVGRVTTKSLQETDNNYPVTIQGVISKAWLQLKFIYASDTSKYKTESFSSIWLHISCELKHSFQSSMYWPGIPGKSWGCPWLQYCRADPASWPGHHAGVVQERRQLQHGGAELQLLLPLRVKLQSSQLWRETLEGWRANGNKWKSKVMMNTKISTLQLYSSGSLWCCSLTFDLYQFVSFDMCFRSQCTYLG